MRGLRSGRAYTSLRRGAIGLVLATMIIPMLGVSAAHAESYQFWGYYNWSKDSWQLAQTGPADVNPKDGDVDGWRFAIGMDEPRPPRADGDFEAICGQTAQPADQKRVAVVLDYGLAEEAPSGDSAPEPRGECAVVPEQASSEQVLSTVADVRAEKGLTCGIDGYPSKGCGDAAEKAADVKLPEPAVELALPDAESGSESRSGDGGSDQGGNADQRAGDDAEQDGTEQAAEQQDSGSGIGLPAIIAIVVILLIAAGALFARSRGRDKAA